MREREKYKGKTERGNSEEEMKTEIQRQDEEGKKEMMGTVRGMQTGER